MRDLQKRKITREYEAVASGIMTKGGTVDQPMARHATKRTIDGGFIQWVNRL